MIKTFRSTNQQGFTLIELMITVILVGIVAAIALPSFNSSIARGQVSSTANRIVGALNYARAEATKRGAEVTIASTATTNNWAGGYQVWLDADGDNAVNGTEVALRSFESINPNLDLTGSAAALRFDGRGFASAAHTLNLCTAEAGAEDRQISVALSGRVEITDFTCP
jgi:type II secretion system protein H